MISGKKVGVVIPSAGTGTRLGGTIAKQFLEIEGKTILARTLEQFQTHPAVDSIAIAGSSDGIATIAKIACAMNATKVVWVGLGGSYRQDSVWNALEQLAGSNVELVLVHDAVRPFVTHDVIQRVLEAAEQYGAAIPAITPKDTVKVATGERKVESTPQRERLWLAQTPQGFRTAVLLSAFRIAREKNFLGTDDASLAEFAGLDVAIVEGSQRNIKITTQEDLIIAQAFLH